MRIGSVGTAAFDGVLLRKDREVAGYTRDALSAETGASVSTLVRMERSQFVKTEIVQVVASALGYPLSRYSPSYRDHIEPQFVVSVSGDWTGFFVECEYDETSRAVDWYVVNEVVSLRQSGSTFVGTATIDGALGRDESPPHKVASGCEERINEGKVVNDLVSFQTSTPNWSFPDGWSTCVLKAAKSLCWMDGFATWQDPETDTLVSSRYILVRQAAANYQQLLSRAESLMNDEMRRLKGCVARCDVG